MSTSLLHADLKPPVAKVVPKVIEAHGDKRQDNYFWLRDDARKDPEVLGYLAEENRYLEAVLKPTEALQKRLYDEILGRIQQTDESVPVRKGEYLYYTRTLEGKQYPVHCRRRAPDGPEEVLVDQNELAAGHKYFRLANESVSPNQQLLLFGTDTAGDEVYTLVFKNLATGQMLADRVTGAYYTVAWAADNQTVFYTVVDAAKRPYKVFRHKLGTNSQADVEVYHEPDERFYVTLAKSKDERFIFLAINSQTTSEIRYLDAGSPSGSLRTLFPRADNIQYAAVHHGESFYVAINDRGRNFRLIRVSDQQPDLAQAVELIPHRPEAYLERIDAFAEHLVMLERVNGLRQIRIADLRKGFSAEAMHVISAPEAAYVFNFDGHQNPEFYTSTLRYTYSSLVTPPSTFDYDMDQRTRQLRKQQPVLGYRPEEYATERIFATAPDGKKIPIALVYRRGLLKRDGSNPALLYGYGAYGSNSEPVFQSDRLSLLDRGFVWAIASIRGGSEMGKQWHDEGRMMNKRNTFTDFIAAAQHLVKENYTRPERLAALGASAGGLLMGAVINLRPDLFGAVIAKVPFVDVLNTMADTSLPLTVGEFEEWGNPADPQAYAYMRSYSPYDNVQGQVYPHLLVTAGLNDPRVSYWEPAKWVAKLRAMKKGDNLLLLKTDMGAGHFGASGRYERIQETALEYAFLLTALKVERP